MEQELRVPWPFDSAGLGENTLQLCRPSVVVSSDSRHLKRALRPAVFGFFRVFTVARFDH